jgi:A/G-specific adenine glycosylase
MAKGVSLFDRVNKPARKKVKTKEGFFDIALKKKKKMKKKKKKVVDIEDLVNNIIGWWDEQKIVPPWGKDCSDNPYKVWVALVMGQQTSMRIVKKKFQQWINVFPTLKSLADAKKNDLFKHWGLGYNNRVLNLRKTARTLVKKNDSCFPKTIQELKNLPGIGDYTANALASICFGVVTPLIDVNVIRVVKRVFGEEINPKKKSFEMIQFVDDKRCGDFHQAIMDLGVYICTKKSPKCQLCPIRKNCSLSTFVK